MTYSIVHKGLAGEFDFYAPLGWQHWLMENLRENQRFGLPLVVALRRLALNLHH